MEVSQTLVENNRTMGAFLRDGDGFTSTATFTDIVIRNTKERPSNGNDGEGIAIVDGTILRVQRALIENNKRMGIWVKDSGTTLEMEDAIVRGTESAVDALPRRTARTSYSLVGSMGQPVMCSV